MLAFCPVLHAADKIPAPLTKTFELPVETIYASVIQVASRDYNLKSSVREGHTATFYTGGQFSLVLSAICREAENNETVVSISIAQAVGNPQLFGVAKAKDKETERFWNELDTAIQVNERLKPTPTSPSQALTEQTTSLIVKSTPDGADITLDGKFAGNTPSTIQVSAGDHQVRIDVDGFQPWEKLLTVTAGGQITLNATLQKNKTAAPQ
jgi:hypothetical protein